MIKNTYLALAITAVVMGSCTKDKPVVTAPPAPVSPKIEWSKNWGGPMADYGYASVKTPDGGIMATGKTYSNDGDIAHNKGNDDAWLLKVSSAGALQWQKTMGGLQNDITNSIQAVNDNTFFITGNTNSTDGDVIGYKGGNDIWVMKIQAK
jgi:hypothetical protein